MILLPLTAMKEDVFHRAGSRPLTLSLAAFDEVLTNGGHHPLLARMDGGATTAGRWVIKPMFSVSAANRRPGLSLIAEVVGAEMCARLGLLTPEIGFIRFPQDSAELERLAPASLWQRECREVSSLNRGELAFCCRFVARTVLVEPDLLPSLPSMGALLVQTARIVLLDVFLVHHDRRLSNPNLLLLGDQLVVIDHGDALAGLERPGETGEGLAQRTVLPRVVREHVLFGWLKQHAEQID